MNDYSQLNDTEIEHEIINRLGWKVVRLEQPEVVHVDGYTIEQWYYLADEKGERIGWAWDTEVNVWEHADIPEYATDLNVAIMLRLTDPEMPMVKYAPQLWCMSNKPNHEEWHATFQDELPDDACYGWIADTPARAICLAWLQWSNAQP